MAKVLIPLAPGFEELEAVTLIDLLRRAKIQVVSAGLAAGPVTASRGTVILPDTTLDEALGQEFDMVVLPGGLPGSTNLDADPRIRQLLQGMHQRGKPTAAICAAPLVLANAGLLKGRRATSYPGCLTPRQLEGVDYQEAPVVRDGTVITSRGPGTAMDFALELIGVLVGTAVRDQVELSLQRPPRG